MNTAQGALGDDTYFFELATGGDSTHIVEENGEGTDTLEFYLMTIGVGDGAAVDLADAAGLVAEHTNDATRQVTTDAAKIINLENVVGSDGIDMVVGSAAANVLSGGLGNDQLEGGLGDDQLDGGAGNDTLLGGKNEDTLTGGTGTNELRGGPNDDIYLFVPGATGTDTLVEDPAEIINGQSVIGGSDTLDFSQFLTAVTFELSKAGPQIPVAGLSVKLENGAGGSDPNHFENVISSSTAVNTLTGNAADNVLAGGSANDVLGGGNADDTLIGGLGDDQLSGQAGQDVLVYDGADVTLVDGGADNDTLRFDTAATIDLTAASQLASIERLDLTDGSGQDVKIDDGDVVNLASGNTMTVDGGAEDIVRLVSTCTLQNNLPVGFDTYTRNVSTVVVDQDVTVMTSASLTATLRGDFNFDQSLDARDIDLLYGQMGQSDATAVARIDLVDDGMLDENDVENSLIRSRRNSAAPLDSCRLRRRSDHGWPVVLSPDPRRVRTALGFARWRGHHRRSQIMRRTLSRATWHQAPRLVARMSFCLRRRNSNSKPFVGRDRRDTVW